MNRNNKANELADWCAQLRWYLWGCREGGIRCLERSPAKPVEEAPPPAPVSGTEKLSRISEELNGCTRCRLHSGRSNLVFGEGSAQSGLVFVGEAPGYDEDQQGRPFVGRAGKLLDKMIFAMGLERTEVYICNVLKCRPPDNRTPQADEVAACSPFLFRQIDALCPKVLCALGLSAAQALLGTTDSMSQLRGTVRLWRGIPLVCTYHPAYLLRSPARKASAWQDLKEVMRLLRE
ncbi:MAG: uracil-DNA glycosylase [Syntrophobacteraceae bacterium]|nr:uracil-DNA glycosylase [Syntrophobacteraceae bacterium]